MNEPHYEAPAGVEFVQGYFRSLFKILFHPVDFFRNQPLDGGFSRPLAFALITHWLGTGVEFLWNSGLGLISVPTWKRAFDRFGGGNDIEALGRIPWFHQTQELVMKWFWGTGSVIADPFITAGRLLISAVFIYIGATLLIDPRKSGRDRIRYSAVLSILCFATSATLFKIVPWMGAPIALFYGFVLSVIGIKQCFRIGTGRSLAVVLFPKLLLAATVIFAVVAFATLLFGLFKFLG